MFRATLFSVIASVLLGAPGAAQTPRYTQVGKAVSYDQAMSPGTGVFQHVAAGTTYYGGTVWAADSSRWEALPDSCWTFDTGVGSAIVGVAPSHPHVDPDKSPGLHALMEGWIGVDRSRNSLPFFRRLNQKDTRWGVQCVGLPGGLEGDFSFWAGAFENEADSLCFGSGQGYGNSWDVCITQTFAYAGGPVAFEFNTVVETEPNMDIATVEIDTAGAGTFIEVMALSGSISGIQPMPLIPGIHLPTVAGSVEIRFCFRSDDSGSDEDGLFPTACGAFAVDEIQMIGGITHTADFETGNDGWSLVMAPGPGGEWSTLEDLSNLSPLTSCPCAMNDSVLVFFDPGLSGHAPETDNLAVSPWIDLLRHGETKPGMFIQFDGYFELPLLNYVFVQAEIQWYPEVCPVTNGKILSPFSSNGFVHYFGSIPKCTAPGDPIRYDFAGVVPCSVTDVRIALGVASYCQFFPACSGTSNETPWFDNVKLGVYGSSAAPTISARSIDLPQDTFPENGTLDISAPGRLDSGTVKGDPVVGTYAIPEIGSSLGDTLTVSVGSGNCPVEVHVQFAVTPGPGINPTDLAGFYSRTTFRENRNGQAWYSARMDTAEVNGVQGLPRRWMTAYHEEDPFFGGTDTDLDPTDLGPIGQMIRLENDIFPDDLFPPGTRVNLFYKARFIPFGPWAVYPDTTGANYLEFECLPASMTPDEEWNCLLYVDHFDGRGAQPVIELHLGNLLGFGSSNFEGTNWDRYDVRAPSSQQATLGRPLTSEFGARVEQLMGYSGVFWNSGDLPSVNLVKEDADVLIPWFSLVGFGPNHLYLSGDGLAASMTQEAPSEPSVLVFLNDYAGVSWTCDTFRIADCPLGTIADASQCVEIAPAGPGLVAGSIGRSVVHRAQGNGCPELRSFDVINTTFSLFGTSIEDERYDNSPAGAKSADYAAVALDGDRKMVTDGFSVHYRRDGGTPCDYELGGTVAVKERLEEVLEYFALGSGILCFSPDGRIGVDPPSPAVTTALGQFSPNPLPPGDTGKISFTMTVSSHAQVSIYDLNGRLVRTVFRGRGLSGENRVDWDGRDGLGRPVAGGVYFYRLSALGKEFSRKVVVVGN